MSRLSLATYSYTSSFSSSCEQYPNKLTTFLCCTRDSNFASFMNSFFPWPEFWESLLTAIILPSFNFPYTLHNHIYIRNFYMQIHRNCALTSSQYDVISIQYCRTQWLFFFSFCRIVLFYIQLELQKTKEITLKTGPNPPWPSLLSGWKSLVAETRVSKANTFCSWAAIFSISSPCSSNKS